MERYAITVDGSVGSVVTGALEGFELRPAAPGQSCLVGDVADQAAFGGLLDRLQDMRVTILEVRRVDEH